MSNEINVSPDSAPLSGQVALITGASGGIGSAIAIGFARQRISLVLAGRSKEALASLAAKAREEKVDVFIYNLDLENDVSVQNLKSSVIRDVGKIDILVHSAGIFKAGYLEDTPVDVLDHLYRINLRAPYSLTRSMLPLLRKQKGQIVFINSTAVIYSHGSVGQYSASKSGLKSLSDSLREEVNSDGIRVLSLFVGRTATPMQKKIHENEGKEYLPDRLIQPEDIARIVVSSLSLPRTVEITDIMLRPMAKPI